ncbi:MAG: SEA (Seh1-associated) complex subunit [Peltula sp. TS41687]|nr:MAG: SEA (Seh1-associated) complex subunit [Peltula sp. TS41687]
MSDLFSPRFAPPQIPPPAPPLPPSRYVNRATTALARFAQPFIGSSRPSSAQAHRTDDAIRRSAPSVPPQISSIPVSPQTVTHKTAIPISALDISPQRTHAVLAGREILKTIRISGAACEEDFNLRAAIIAHASTHGSGPASQSLRLKDDLAANDVKWSHGSYNSTIATAATNGKIMLYDINRAGVELARLHDHTRQVHRLAFNPHQGYFLLSASQDGMVRLWDLRATAGGRGVLSFRSSRKYHAHGDGIRDVKWSPTDGTEFACATDAGSVQRWDFRQEKAPVLKVTAHGRMCQTIDWHPDGKHLVSGGADKMVLVWDFSSSDRKQNSPWSFRAPQPVTRVRWRPVEWKATSQGSGAWETTHLVTSYKDVEPRVHIWNLQRPNVPFKELDRYNSAPTDLLWHSEDLLWTVGPEGIFTQTNVHFAPRTQDRRMPTIFALSPDGEITVFAHKRVGRSAERREAPLSRRSRSHGKLNAAEKLSGSRSTDEEGGISFLGASFGRRRGRSWSAKLSKSAGNTPPSEGSPLTARKLDEIMSKRTPVKTVQVGFVGKLSIGFGADEFVFLATNYRVTNKPLIPNEVVTLGKTEEDMEYNARLAERVGMYRTAQTWRMLKLALKREQRIREEWSMKKKKVDEGQQREHHVLDDAIQGNMAGKRSPQTGPRHPISPVSRPIAGLSGNITSIMEESASRMSTPLARPLPESREQSSSPASMRLDEGDSLLQHSTAYTLSRSEDNPSHSPDSPAHRPGSSDSQLLFSTSSDEGRRRTPVPNSFESKDPGSEEREAAENKTPTRRGRHATVEDHTYSHTVEGIGEQLADVHLKENINPNSPSHHTEHGNGPQRSTHQRKQSFSDTELEAFILNDPFGIHSMLTKIIEYYLVQMADQIHPATFLLTLQPFLPPDPIPHAQASAIMTAYLHQLEMHSLTLQAAQLRNLCYPLYPRVYSTGQYNVDVKTMCRECNARMRMVPTKQNPPPKRRGWACEKCGRTSAPCPVCRTNSGRGWWAWCQGCGHGGHAECLKTWFAEPQSGGGCCVEGCLHGCMRYQQRMIDKLGKGRHRAGVGGLVRSGALVKGDEWVVDESRAVERVRWGLAGGALAGGGGGGRITPGLAGKTGAHGHQGEKRVRVVTPSEEGG